MRRREFTTVLCAAVVAGPFSAFAQVPAPRPVVAVLLGGSSTNALVLNSFVQGMQELGYVEGRDIDIASRYAEGDLTRMSALATELIRYKPAVFVTGTLAGTLAIKQTAATIPIVNPSIADPIAFGLVESQARPGGQVTGILFTLDSLPGKQLELMLEAVPRAKSIGMLLNVNNPATMVNRRNADTATTALLVKLVPVEIRVPADIDDAFQRLVKERVEAVLVPPEVLVLSERKQIAALAAKARLPAIYGYREHVEDGGLMSYGINLRESWRRAAAFVDKILKGANPGDLPVELPTTFELVINLKTAKALGLTIPPSLLARADEVIE
jgi:putative ABC transport system substrate-binding protein